MGDGAVRNATKQTNLVAWRASVMSVVRGSNPDKRLFFGFLSEKWTFRKNAQRGAYIVYGGVILYNTADLASERGHGGSGITAQELRGCLHWLSKTQHLKKSMSKIGHFLDKPIFARD